jgi:hypothetical protein
MKKPLRPYPRTPLDDCDDIVEFDFVDTSALGDIGSFEHWRQNSKDGVKLSKKD